MQFAWFNYFQLGSLLTAIICYRGLKKFSLVAFIPYLFLTNAAEIAGQNYRTFGLESNYLIYNVYLLLSTPFYFYIASKLLFLTRKEKMVFLLVCVLSLLLMLLNFWFMQGQADFDSYSLVLIEIMTIVFSSLSLVRLAVLDTKEMNFLNEPFFWINAANLFFGLITLVVLGLQDYIRTNHITIGRTPLYSALMPMVNMIVYLGFSYAFILCRIPRTR